MVFNWGLSGEGDLRRREEERERELEELDEIEEEEAAREERERDEEVSRLARAKELLVGKKEDESEDPLGIMDDDDDFDVARIKAAKERTDSERKLAADRKAKADADAKAKALGEELALASTPDVSVDAAAA